ncbi:type I-B CRISPR-associated protein Cas7/Cst2/DevR [Pseudothermotoga thermarum]|uniref:CRISPR-associated autoregulator, Cst2 family n=1 Tax=Pseudothermotoga thermarum DSM 5069 TaxID=688269 RepID=F7YTK9_9THEM|nr:type I-B CRISPR-associated protein Cas7/Cst2/DevR [Pseudothermotoga thermarum]AEH51231.1 CRISPR-associated autoregulator, Cst2 family [Pseudothermotoga thermarum DSM 5069]
MNKPKAVCIGYLSKVSVGNVNSSHTEGNVIVAKKVTLPDGNFIPYYSGQCIRRIIKDRFEDFSLEVSDLAAKVENKQVLPPVRPWEFIDEDLFGYMEPGGRKRTSPVRVSAAIGLFQYQGDRDLGTRNFQRFGLEASEGGNMYETEVYANLFRGNILVELDRLGVFSDLEIGEEAGKHLKDLERVEKNGRIIWVLPKEKRVERLKWLLEAVKTLWGGGRTARLLSDLSPKFFAYAKLTTKHPVFLESIEVKYSQGKYELILDPLLSTVKKFGDYADRFIFGFESGFLSNENDIRKAFSEHNKVTVCHIHEAFEEAKKDVESI